MVSHGGLNSHFSNNYWCYLMCLLLSKCILWWSVCLNFIFFLLLEIFAFPIIELFVEFSEFFKYSGNKSRIVYDLSFPPFKEWKLCFSKSRVLNSKVKYIIIFNEFCFWNHIWPTQGSQRFSSRSFIGLNFTFRILFHFECVPKYFTFFILL